MYKILANSSFSADLLHYLPSCHSTNEIAQAHLRQDAREGTIIITDDQFAGKGQKGNAWVSEPGQNLTFSIILKPQHIAPNRQFLITVAVSLAIKETLEYHLPGEVQIKWPNDIYFNKKKLAGLLIENTLRGSRFESCIVGLGLNVNQKEFSEALKATSLAIEAGKQFSKNLVLNQLLEGIAKYYDRVKMGNGHLLIPKYHNALMGFHKICRFRASNTEFEGIIEGTDDFGRLMIRRDEDLALFQHKEVTMLL